VSGNGLFGSTILDVILGLVFVYLLLAIICTTVNEWIAGIFNTRATTLAAAIRQLLDSQGGSSAANDTDWFLKQFYGHPLIAGMKPSQGAHPHPAYLASRAFATAIIDIVTPQNSGSVSFADLENGINKLPDGDVKRTLLALIHTAQGDFLTAQKNIETWFDDTMDRVSGWYKRRTQLWTALLALLLTVGTNADTVKIAGTLWRNPTRREQILESAKNPVQPAATVSTNQLDALGQVLGWTSADRLPQAFTPADRASFWFRRLIGWILTIVAVSLGAPFWFDLLNTFMRIRNGGDSPKDTAA